MPPELFLFITNYGYLAILVGCMIEGEAFVVIGSFFAYHGTMYLPMIALMAFIGTMISDIGWFMIGRYSSDTFLHRWRWLRYISNHSIKIVSKRPRLLTFFFRFMYGFRIVIPFSLGKTSISTSTYLVYSALGVLLWVAVYASIGYFFAGAIEVFFGRIKHIELVIGLVILGTLVIFTFGHHIAQNIIARFSKN